MGFGSVTTPDHSLARDTSTCLYLAKVRLQYIWRTGFPNPYFGAQNMGVSSSMRQTWSEYRYQIFCVWPLTF